jgi:hypothetical protein
MKKALGTLVSLFVGGLGLIALFYIIVLVTAWI